ncbi:MAG: FAD-binding dehydrogenase [Bacteroidota bacterium]
MSSLKYQADVIIVGGGLAGIVAALDLLDTGKKILIIDRDSEANFGGLAKWAFGGMFFVNSKHQRRAGIKDSVDLAMKDWFSFAEFEENEHWGKKWAEQYIHLCTPHSYEYLKHKGLGFFPVLNWVERGLYKPGNSVPRFHMVLGTGWELTYALIRQLKAHANYRNVNLQFEHRVLEIIEENGAVKGVRGKLENGEKEFEASGEVTIVATGGINGSIEKVKANWHKAFGTPPKTILNGAHQYALGDLHDATEKISGSVVNLDKQWNYAAGIHHYKPRKERHGLSLVPCKSALWMNYEGRRMGPMPLITAYDTRYLVERICQEPVKYSWQILNMKIAKKEFAISGSEHNELMRDKKILQFVLKTALVGNGELMNKIIENCEDVVIGNSLEELVEKMNEISEEKAVKLKYVKEAVENYDAQIDRGSNYHNDEQLRRIAHARQYRGDKVRTCKFQKILDTKAMPLIAMKEYILSRKSLGGIQTNLESQVLSQADTAGNQQVISGLYAIGEAAGFGGGGMHGHRSLEGTFLGGCVISARVAAASIKGQKLE